jgi:hypothetical protein
MIRALKPFFTFSSPDAETERVLAIGGWLLFALITWWAIFYVPMGMDESLPYHALACLDYPFAKLHTFREGCDGRYDLKLFGLHIPGSFQYAGGLSSLLYAPVFFLFRAPAGQYWFGIAFFLVFAMMMARLMAKPALGLPVVLSFFPFLFQFIHDTGPIHFSMLVFPLGAVLFRRMTAEKQNNRWLYALGLALIVFLALEDKIFFVYLLPGVAFFSLAFTGEENWAAFSARLKKFWLPVLGAIILTAAGLLTLLFADSSGMTYLKHVESVAENKFSAELIFQTFLIFFFAWPAYAHRIFTMPSSDFINAFMPDIALALCLFTVCCSLAFLKRLRPFYLAPRTCMLVLSFIAIGATFLILGNVWAGHHFVFMWVPLIVLFVDLLATLQSAVLIGVTAIFFVTSALPVLELSLWPIETNTARDRENIFAYFQDKKLAASAIINYSTWGGYYINALYGPKDQLVTYIQPLTHTDAQKLLALAHKTGRRIYNVCSDPFFGTPYQGIPIIDNRKWYKSICDKTYLEDMFDDKLRFEDVMPEQKIWHVFAASPR